MTLRLEEKKAELTKIHGDIGSATWAKSEPVFQVKLQQIQNAIANLQDPEVIDAIEKGEYYVCSYCNSTTRTYPKVQGLMCPNPECRAIMQVVILEE